MRVRVRERVRVEGKGRGTSFLLSLLVSRHTKSHRKVETKKANQICIKNKKGTSRGSAGSKTQTDAPSLSMSLSTTHVRPLTLQNRANARTEGNKHIKYKKIKNKKFGKRGRWRDVRESEGSAAGSGTPWARGKAGPLPTMLWVCGDERRQRRGKERTQQRERGLWRKRTQFLERERIGTTRLEEREQRAHREARVSMKSHNREFHRKESKRRLRSGERNGDMSEWGIRIGKASWSPWEGCASTGKPYEASGANTQT